MLLNSILLLGLVPLIQAQETVLGVFIFHRHGDRTAKAWTPSNLTDLGYAQVYAAGNYFRNKYLMGPSKIYNVQPNIVKLSQINVQAPVDNVLQSSAQGFLQGLYPPVGAPLNTQLLANGSTITAPLNGYQLIPINLVSSVSGANSENTQWLQGISGCYNAIISSNNYFISQDYFTMLNKTMGFYQNLNPVVNGSFNAAYNTYKNAYAVYDLIHVATINNATIPSASLLTPDTLFQLQTLADYHEFNLAYNASEKVRAIAGSTLAAQILQHLNDTITGKSATKIGIQFNAYASFLAFFGLSQLSTFSSNFTAIVDYASSMTFELVTNSTVNSTSYPTTDNISVRFLYANGSAAYNTPVAYPLFGQSQTLIPYSTFVSEMSKFAIGDSATWCTVCGNTTGVCAPTSTASPAASSSAAAASMDSGSGGMSLAVAGVIGAMVTLAVILGVEALILLLAGLRVVNKKRLAGTPAPTATGGKA